jgi:hypothetical protein
MSTMVADVSSRGRDFAICEVCTEVVFFDNREQSVAAAAAHQCDPLRVASVVDMDAVCEALNARGVSAYVEQTGGGCATISIGHQDPEGRFQALAGPGGFYGPRFTKARGHVGDFCVGPDDDGESEVSLVETTDINVIADMIEAVING